MLRNSIVLELCTFVYDLGEIIFHYFNGDRFDLQNFNLFARTVTWITRKDNEWQLAQKQSYFRQALDQFMQHFVYSVYCLGGSKCTNTSNEYSSCLLLSVWFCQYTHIPIIIISCFVIDYCSFEIKRGQFSGVFFLILVLTPRKHEGHLKLMTHIIVKF